MQKCDFAALDIKQKSKRKRAGAAQAASAFSFFACLRGKPDPLRCCFPLFPRRIARERAMFFRGNSPLSACAALRARQPPCSKCAHRKVRFSVAGIKLYLGAASRCRSPYPQKFTSSALTCATSRTRSENAHAAF